MGYTRTKGIVIKEINTGEADKIITVFSGSLGKISASAKGARRPRSKYIAGTQFLCYSDFILFKGRDMYSVNSCDVIESFYEIRNDIEKLTYSAHITEIIYDVIQENQPSSRVLQLLLNTLHMLTKTDKSPELMTRIFELRLLSILGYAPYVQLCMDCGDSMEAGAGFSFKKCGLLCSKCCKADESAISVLPGTVKTLQHIVTARIQDLFSFNVSEQVLRELSRISRRYLRERLEKDYHKLDFLNSLEVRNLSFPPRSDS